MYSIKEKREISRKIQEILRETNHPELPDEDTEIEFHIHVKGAEDWSWADIYNNNRVKNPQPNPWNEQQEISTKPHSTDLHPSIPRVKSGRVPITPKDKWLAEDNWIKNRM